MFPGIVPYGGALCIRPLYGKEEPGSVQRWPNAPVCVAVVPSGGPQGGRGQPSTAGAGDRRAAPGAAGGGLRTSQFAPIDQRSLDGHGPIDARGEVPCAQNHLWFPTLKFNVLPGHPNLSIGPLWPTSPVTCEGYLDYWFADSADQHWIDELFALDAQVGAEDTALVEAAQRGTSAGMIDRGWALGGTEALMGHFQDFVRGRLGLDNDPR